MLAALGRPTRIATYNLSSRRRSTMDVTSAFEACVENLRCHNAGLQRIDPVNASGAARATSESGHALPLRG
jgi:hypothetical protein